MATYTELRGAFANDALRNKITMATVIAAYGLLAGAPTTADRKWINAVFERPDQVGRVVYMGILAANAGASIATIEGATDAAILTQVEVVVPQLVLAMSGA